MDISLNYFFSDGNYVVNSPKPDNIFQLKKCSWQFLEVDDKITHGALNLMSEL